MTDEISAANRGQIDYWNATAGHSWAQFHAELDRQIGPLGLAAMQVSAPKPGESWLDIGCGCGDTTLQLAERLRPDGRVIGVDISEPMLEIAHRRKPDGDEIQFRLADAQEENFGPAHFDGVFSRFGVMFFSNPVKAFSNLRRSLKPSGRLAFVCWRDLAASPWMTLPLATALPFLPPRPETDPHAPGPFAFADSSRVEALLAAAGFTDIAILPHDAMIGGADIEATRRLMFRVGPLAGALRETPDAIPAVTDALRNALAAHLTAEGVFLKAGVWLVVAR